MIRAVLCDIEGTTTSLSFVHDVLFPLSREKMDSFIRENWTAPELQPILDDLKKKIPIENPPPPDVVALLQAWIDADKKDRALKEIQGRIWKEAFESGKIRAPVYPDVPEKWAEWKRQGLSIYIFSSGSIEAQQLLFRYSEAGDLTHFIDGYFDTTTGPKKVAASYEKIANTIEMNPADILFLSDMPAELDAARQAGMQTIQLMRDSVHLVARTFHEI
ncbi:acireductone synthase [bacterium]|nr:acireductone synthase [bacterium]MCI0603101.1 acireductone synthase [bacterium]